MIFKKYFKNVLFRHLFKSTFYVLFSEDPCQEYNILDESSRNKNYVDNAIYYCDQEYDLKHGELNPHLHLTSWKGPGWYRFMEPAGTQLIEYEHITGQGQCSAMLQVYLVGDHNSIQMGEIVDREVCMFNSNIFNQNGNACVDPYYAYYPYHTINIKIKKCEEHKWIGEHVWLPFYVYELPDVPICVVRYCGVVI